MALLPSFPNMGPEDMPRLTPEEVQQVIEAVEGMDYIIRHEDDQ